MPLEALLHYTDSIECHSLGREVGPPIFNTVRTTDAVDTATCGKELCLVTTGISLAVRADYFCPQKMPLNLKGLPILSLTGISNKFIATLPVIMLLYP